MKTKEKQFSIQYKSVLLTNSRHRRSPRLHFSLRGGIMYSAEPMLDLGYVREHLDLIEKMARDRGLTLDLAPFRQLDTDRRMVITSAERLKAERNKASEEIARMKKSGEDASSLLALMKQVSDQIKRDDETITVLDEQLKQFLLTVPNIPHSSVPVGKSAADNVEVRRWGAPPQFDFKPKAHWELGEGAGILDFDAAIKIAGSRFAVYKGLGARLERALANFFLDVHTREHGYTEILPPFLVNTASLIGVGQLPKFAADMFHLEGTDLWLTPTSEVELTSLYRDTTLEPDALPIKVCAWTACFRSEAGAAGTRHARPEAPAPISKSRNVQIHAPGAKLRRVGKAGSQRRSNPAAPGPALSRDAAKHRGHGIRVSENLRYRSVAPLRCRVHGNFLLLQHRIVPGASLRHPFQAPRREKIRIRPHVEWLRPGSGTHLDRAT